MTELHPPECLCGRCLQEKKKMAEQAIPLNQPTQQVDVNVIPIVKLLDDRATVPQKAHVFDAGSDLCALEDVTLPPDSDTLVRTGIALVLPNGIVGLVAPRSGMAAKKGVTVSNSPGVIDPGYLGEVMVALRNRNDTEYEVKAGDRIAQLILMPFVQNLLMEVDPGLWAAVSSERGDGGFGSTGG